MQALYLLERTPDALISAILGVRLNQQPQKCISNGILTIITGGKPVNFPDFRPVSVPNIDKFPLVPFS